MKDGVVFLAIPTLQPKTSTRIIILFLLLKVRYPRKISIVGMEFLKIGNEENPEPNCHQLFRPLNKSIMPSSYSCYIFTYYLAQKIKD